MLKQYLISFEAVLALTIPTVICMMALRRLILSHSFNRVLYAVTALISGETVLGILGAPTRLGMPEASAPLYAYVCLALWLVVLTFAPSTRGHREYELHP